MVLLPLRTFFLLLRHYLFTGLTTVFLFTSVSKPQIITPRFENISIKDGLPENSAVSIIQDHLGFMWFGTQNGLVRYDGYQMKIYPYNPGDSLSVSECRITALYEDRSGTLWIGTVRDLNRFDRVTEKFKRITITDDTLSNYSRSITSIYEDKKGNLWIGTRSGLYLLNRKTGAFKSIYFKDRIYSQGVYDFISDLIRRKSRVQGILNAGNSENIRKSFHLKKKTPVLIVMTGEDGNDYGYLKDSRGKTIFTYDYNNSVHAGGLKENRIQIMIDTLTEGNYTLYYKSDYYYSYQDSFTNQTKYYHAHMGNGPLHPEYWGIQVFDISDDVSEIQKVIGKQQTIFNSAEVFSMIEEPTTGKLYIGTFCQGLWELDNKMESIVRSKTSYENITASDAGSFRSFCKAKNGSIWIASSTGALNFYPYENRLKFYAASPINAGLPEKEFSAIVEDNYGTVWIGSALTGMFYLDLKLQQISRIDTVIYPDKSRFYQVLSSCVDKSGVLWIGTWTTGIEKWDRNKDKLKQYSINRLSNELETDFNILSICEDPKGITWLGTDHGLISYDRNNGVYLRYYHNPGDPNSLSNDDIYCVKTDRVNPEILWIATHSGLNEFNSKTKKFKRYKIVDEKFPEQSLNNIPFIHQDRRGTFWICTRNGLYTFDKINGIFSRVVLKKINSTDRGKNLNYVPLLYIYEDKQNIFWPYVVGSGLPFIYPSEQTWKNLWTFPNGDYYIAASAWCEDSKNNLWIGDYTSGIHLFNRKDETSVNYSEKAELINKTIYSMTADDRDNLWILSELELTRFNPSTNRRKTFSNEDGLVEMKYIYFDMFYKNSRGEILICGTNGFNAFYPDSVKDDPAPPGVVIDKISLFNRPDERLNYEGFISELKEIILPYNQNDLHFDYVGLHYGEPLANQYRYILEGFDKKWVNAGIQRTATYTNLSPGKYIFRVKASNRDGVWNEAGTSLTIIINPPVWATTWAYLFYFLMFISSIYCIWKLQLKRIRIKQEYEMSKFETQKLHEVDEIKSRFFTNISHEFRTPLTLILGPVKQAIERLKDEKTKEDLKIVHKNANKLLGLVNQLLDISKLESGNMRLLTAPQNIIQFLKAIVLSFTSYAERKKIDLVFNSAEEKIIVYLDKDKLEKIITNILSNAFKFTPDGGRIGVDVYTEEKYVKVSISDTGVGISKEKMSKIFDRFYQVDGSHTREQEGTGIGLALTKELVELHKGKIEVESEEGKGTTFTVSIPLGKDHLKPEEIYEEDKDREKEPVEEFSQIDKYEKDSVTSGLPGDIKRTGEDTIDFDLPVNDSTPLLLIVEDNSDVRYYIKDNLKRYYNILEAANGEEGLQKSIEQVPDLIISDVMMPKMDGFKLCEKLKTDEKTSHIPVILLTAKAAKQDKIEGYETGADDYIMKPFEPVELRARIRNLIEQRKRLHEHFQKDGIWEIDKTRITSVDKKFLMKAFEVINKNLSDSSFTVEAFASDLFISKSLLHKKIVSLTGDPPVELIRRIRLKKAAKLIEKKFGNLSEIALEVGFNNPAYFSECFKKQFGVSPSRYRQTSPGN